MLISNVNLIDWYFKQIIFILHFEETRELFYVPVEPHCRTSQQRVYGVARLEEVTVSCAVDANPPALWFRWSFNNSAIQAKTVESFEAGGGRSIANYKPISEADYGTLLCWGRNSLGSQLVPCVFHIVPAGELLYNVKQLFLVPNK